MDDSSPDLSLKLRRGSSDSRESFYMDFAQGIDSDIEEVTTIERAIPEHPGGRAEGDADTLATPSGLDENKDIPQWWTHGRIQPMSYRGSHSRGPVKTNCNSFTIIRQRPSSGGAGNPMTPPGSTLG
ncbi:Proton channel OtopLc [Eumeta japonica]|uniref:Proton channel OtopLc n=1 Tax=Eumeta variegata TaxID=151549 RepID=A0A4C2A7H2_EUMVA|nr:Proton channel OtopLc [Eumeta japonica]